ncbi:MAG: hypothetical protein KF777_15805 [Planctomycetaceae bacterium]|nr:hypothetical protein [Planctomycetaceae bacterium]
MIIKELYDSPNFDGQNMVRKYSLQGPPSIGSAMAAVLGAIPSVDPDSHLAATPPRITRLGDILWSVEVTYSAAKPPEFEAVVDYQFQTETIQVQRSLQVVGAYPRSGITAPNMAGAIGVTRDGIAGASQMIPVERWTERYSMPKRWVRDALLPVLRAIHCRVNLTAFRGHAAGEVLLTGATVTDSLTEENITVSLEFARSENFPSLTVGNIGGINKDGWDLVDVLWDETAAANGDMIIKTPRVVYVHRMYPRVDYGYLNLPA